MDRKGQTWCAEKFDVVFVVLRSQGRTTHWAHDVVYLENGSAPHMTGTRGELLESSINDFDAFLKRLV